MCVLHKNITINKRGQQMKLSGLKNIKEDLNNCAIELYSNKRIIVLDCKCVVDYSKDCIVLDLGELNLRIKGENLVADSFVFGQTDISGQILSLEFI